MQTVCADIDILSLTRELCRFSTGVVAEENELLFTRLLEELPFRIYRYKSGDVFNGWVVPQLWRVHRASIRRGDKLVFDGKIHTLAVAKYSTSFQGEVDLETLKTHLVTNPDIPQAYVFHCMWQYRPWAPSWAFCIPYEIYKTLDAGTYSVDLVTTYEPGEMLVGEYEHTGRTDQTIVVNSNTCHPHQANDGFAGVALLVRLFQWLRNQDTHYSYRLVLGPEHLGSVFYLRDRGQDDIRRCVSGIFAEMPGTHGPLKITSTFIGNQPIDVACRHAARQYSRGYNCVPWRKGAGNDETVWEAPGYEIPFVEVTRCEDQFAPYTGYHSSHDSPDLMDAAQLNEFYSVLQHTIEILESNSTLHRLFDGLICLSNPQYDLYLERPDPAATKDLEIDAEKWGYLLDCLFRYLDGSMTILDIAEKHDLPFDRLHRYLTRFCEKGLARMEFAPIQRTPISKRAQT